jgi:hypothetical protein
MGRILALLIATVALLPAAAAEAGDPDVVAPFRFRSPTQDLATPAEQQRALSYQNELDNQLRQLDQAEQRGQLGPLGRRRLLDTRDETGRINGALGPKPSGGLGITGTRPLPSLSGGGTPLLPPPGGP